MTHFLIAAGILKLTIQEHLPNTTYTQESMRTAGGTTNLTTPRGPRIACQPKNLTITHMHVIKGSHRSELAEISYPQPIQGGASEDDEHALDHDDRQDLAKKIA